MFKVCNLLSILAVVLPEEYFTFDHENLIMIRTDFQDSYDEESESELSSSSQVVLPEGINELKERKITQSQKKLTGKKPDKQEEEETTYSAQIRSNNVTYVDRSSYKSSGQHEMHDIYSYDEESSQNEEVSKEKRNRKKEKIISKG